MQQQKMMLYILPLVFGIGGINFPIGVLIYWTASNLWTLGQQFWVIRNNPTPGSEAERELNARRAAKGLPQWGRRRPKRQSPWWSPRASACSPSARIVGRRSRHDCNRES